MTTLQDQKFDLHRILIKLFENPEIEQRLTDFLYDEISSKYKDLQMFSYDGDDKSFNITFESYYPGIENNIKFLYGEFVNNLLKDVYITNIVSQIDGNTVFINMCADFINIARECITVLNMSTSKESMVLKINLHN